MNAWDEIAMLINMFDIKAIVIRLTTADPTDEDKEIVLSCSIKDFQDDESYSSADFHEKFNVEYSDGYGGQQLFGTIWMLDGTWWTRGEYDGSEWWQHHVCPEYDPDQHTGMYGEPGNKQAPEDDPRRVV
jgi:hypothetical protein